MGNLLFSPKGRINSSEFMKGAIVVIVIAAILNLLPLVSYNLAMIFSLLGLVLIWPIIVLAVKRAHDAGKSGWMCLLPIIALIILSVIANSVVTKMFGGDIYTQMQNAMQEAAQSGDLKQVMSVSKEYGQKLSQKTVVPMTVASAVIMYVVAFVYNMLLKHDPEENQWGPA